MIFQVETCQANKTEDVNFNISNMITGVHGSKTITKLHFMWFLM